MEESKMTPDRRKAYREQINGDEKVITLEQLKQLPSEEDFNGTWYKGVLNGYACELFINFAASQNNGNKYNEHLVRIGGRPDSALYAKTNRGLKANITKLNNERKKENK
jgi:hypothetical protein